jgi:hypothetical protein
MPNVAGKYIQPAFSNVAYSDSQNTNPSSAPWEMEAWYRWPLYSWATSATACWRSALSVRGALILVNADSAIVARFLRASIIASSPTRSTAYPLAANIANTNAAVASSVLGNIHTAASPTSAIASTTNPTQLSNSGEVIERRKLPIEVVYVALRECRAIPRRERAPATRCRNRRRGSFMISPCSARTVRRRLARRRHPRCRPCNLAGHVATLGYNYTDCRPGGKGGTGVLAWPICVEKLGQ